MKKHTKIISHFLLLLVLISYNVVAQNNGSLKVEILLNKALLNEYGNNNFINSFVLTKNKNILLSTENQFYIVGLGEVDKIGPIQNGKINAFEFTNKGVLLAVKNNEVCFLDTSSKLNFAYKIPESNFKLSRGKYSYYLYENNKTKNKNTVYNLKDKQGYVKLLEMPKAINSLIEFGDKLLLCNENGLFEFNLIDKTIHLVTNLPKDEIILSICADTLNKRIYFSSPRALYSIKNNIINVVNPNNGGELKYYDDGLFVFDNKNNILLKYIGLDKHFEEVNKKTTTSNLVPKSDSIKKVATEIKSTGNVKTVPSTTTSASSVSTSTNSVKTSPQSDVVKASEQKEIITNASIIKMTKAKLSEDLIINVIKTSDVNFDLKVESMVNLSNNGVSSNVIMEMKNAMEKKKQ